MIKNVVSKQSLQRFPHYLSYLKELDLNSNEYVSATKIAGALAINDVVVRKDLAAISGSGRPKLGYNTRQLIAELESFLGYKDTNDAIIVGAGKLGKALLYYNGFSERGFRILSAFDINPPEYGEDLDEKKILPMSKLIDFCHRTKVRIGIITVPDDVAQAVADLLVECGILALWNFSSVKLMVPENVLVQNENMLASMSALSQHLSDEFSDNK